MRAGRASAPALGCALVVLAACGTDAARQTLRVAAASSLRELVTEGEAAFAGSAGGTALVVACAASSTLARQIEAGAEFDVFLSADHETITRIAPHLVPESWFVFLRNRLVVVGAAQRDDLPQDAKGLVQLPGKLALAGPAVPAGRYARTWLAQRGLLARLEPNIISADNVRAALALVESGAAAAAVVYATDARVAQRARVLFAVPDAEDPGVRYVAAAVQGGRGENAMTYLRWLSSATFLDSARARGFLPPD
jgi:molybdate transport system substrate-binding protein